MIIIRISLLILFSIIAKKDNKLEYIYNVGFLFYLNFDYILCLNINLSLVSLHETIH
jgi:hypothetical protein